MRCSPELEGKSLTKRVTKEIENRFGEIFGDYAGWAHNVLFIAELASYQHYLPVEIRTPHERKGSKMNNKRKNRQN